MQPLKRIKKPINPNILDLFVGMDLEEVKIFDGLGQMQGFHMGKLTNEAIVFLSHLNALGVEDLPEPGELIQEWFQF